MKRVLIVESPTKARTLSGYLGKDYRVISSVGHIRDLPKSKFGVDIEDGFKPTYVLLKGKEKILQAIKREADSADEIILGPDPDREGEAIAWHIAQLLDGGSGKLLRVEFHEITRRAVLQALKSPRQIDDRLVAAQQARRILDRIVGYKLSPLLWRKVKVGLSAGRVQSVAVRLLCEREELIRNFKTEEYWTIKGHFLTESGKEFEARLFIVGERRVIAGGSDELTEPERQMRIVSEGEANEILGALTGKEFSISNIEDKESFKRPPPPFITSSIQQEANRRFGYSGRKTMNTCQSLYEGVKVGDEVAGLITYMRTDSFRVSPEGQRMAREFIERNIGAPFVPEKPHFYASPRGSQGAHEAIRPTDVSYQPDKIKKFLSNEQFRIYDLIWKRFLASQMASARILSRRVDIETTGASSDRDYVFRATGSVILFPGFLKLYEEIEENSKNGNGQDGALPSDLKGGDRLDLKELIPEQHFTKPSARYTEAALIKALEENGIGRPSTYATIVETIVSRQYAYRQEKRFHPTEWAFVVTELLGEYFPDIVDIGFTRDMEENLDRIEEGSEDWQKVLSEFYKSFSGYFKKAEKNLDRRKPKLRETEFQCDKCGSPMVERSGRYGPFIACSRFPECRNTKRLDEVGRPVDSNSNSTIRETDKLCPECRKNLLLKMSRYRTKFYGCSGYPKCKYMEPLQTKCPKCDARLEERTLKNRRKITVCSKECGFSFWGRPLEEHCDLCGYFLAHRGTGEKEKRFCTNKDCPISKVNLAP